MSVLFIIVTWLLLALLIAIVAVGLKKVNDDLNKKVAVRFTKDNIEKTKDEIEYLKKQMESLLIMQEQFEKVLNKQRIEYIGTTFYDTRLRAYTRRGSIYSLKSFDNGLYKKTDLNQKQEIQPWP